MRKIIFGFLAMSLLALVALNLSGLPTTQVQSLFVDDEWTGGVIIQFRFSALAKGPPILLAVTKIDQIGEHPLKVDEEWVKRFQSKLEEFLSWNSEIPRRPPSRYSRAKDARRVT